MDVSYLRSRACSRSWVYRSLSFIPTLWAKSIVDSRLQPPPLRKYYSQDRPLRLSPRPQPALRLAFAYPGAGCGRAPGPRPADQRIFADVMDKIFGPCVRHYGPGSLSWPQISGNRLASHAISNGARCHSDGRHTAGVEIRVLMAGRTAHRRETMASEPRATAAGAAAFRRLCRGRSPAGWQLVQRGWVTLCQVSDMAAERASVSATDAKLSGLRAYVARSQKRHSREHAHRSAATETRSCDRRDFMSLCPPRRSLVRYQIAFGIARITSRTGLMVLDITGAAADVPIEASRWFSPAQFVSPAFFARRSSKTCPSFRKRGAIPALECEVLDEGFCRTESRHSCMTLDVGLLPSKLWIRAVGWCSLSHRISMMTAQLSTALRRSRTWCRSSRGIRAENRSSRDRR